MMLASTQLWWFIARASGIVAWGLLAASVLWGLALTTKILGPRPRANWLLDLHRFLGGLAVVFTAIHLLSLALDSYMHFGLTEMLVPLTSEYRPAAVAWGVVGMYLLIAIELTSVLRARIPRRVWRHAHLLGVPLFAVASVHGLTAGTDTTGAPLFAAMVAIDIVVVALTLARIDQARRRRVLNQKGTPHVQLPRSHPPTATSARRVERAHTGREPLGVGSSGPAQHSGSLGH